MSVTLAPPERATVVVPIVVAALLVLVRLQGDQAMWAAALVGTAGIWAIDIANGMESRGRRFPAIAVVVGAVAGAVISQTMGPGGMATAIAVTVAVVLVWGVAVAGYRTVDAIAPGVMVAILATAAVSSLVLAASEASPDPSAVDVFLIVVIVATLLGLVVDRLSQLPYLDPFTVTALSAIVASVVAALILDLDVAGYLLVGLGLAVALVAGRGLGGLLRTGSVALAERVPGFFSAFDGAILAAALFFPLVRLVL